MSLSSSEFPNISKFFEEPSFNKSYYDLLSDKFRSPHLWYWDDENGWALRKRIFENQKVSQEQSASEWQGNSIG